MPPSLRGFLEAGLPPVYVGFGSIPFMDPVRTTSMVMKALAAAGQRGILASAWGGLTAAPLAEHVYMLNAATHDRLFPHVAAVIHHGGAGTTAAGLCAGKATIICPFFGNQPFWGRRVAMLGVGPAPVPFRYLTPEKLADAIRRAVTDSMMHRRAAELGTRIREENGVGRAVELISRGLMRQPVSARSRS
jgi:sterol 3beta-glucosyltransferase